MNGSVPLEERRRRSKMLRNLSIKKRRSFYQEHIGEMREVLFESESKDGFIYGFTDNYIKVKQPFDPELINQLKNVKLTEVDAKGDMMIKEFQENFTIVK